MEEWQNGRSFQYLVINESFIEIALQFTPTQMKLNIFIKLNYKYLRNN